MKGHGWQCDFEQCGKRQIVPGDHYVNYSPSLPSGWLYLVGPAMASDSPEAWHANESHFCSIRCVAAASAEQVGCYLADGSTG